MIRTQCSRCGQAIKVADEAAGKRGKCPKCGAAVQIPTLDIPDAIPVPPPMLRSLEPPAVVQPLAPPPVVVQPATTVQTAAAVTAHAAAAAGRSAAASMGNALSRFLNEEQDPAIVAQVHTRVQQILTSGEEIQYIAVQKKPVMNLAPDCAVLTNRRFIIYRPKLLGRVTFDDYIWRDLRDVKLEEGLVGATLCFHTLGGQKVSLDYLPKAQARLLYRTAQEMEERCIEERRVRSMEEMRAAAGGVVVQNAMMPAPPQPPMPSQDGLVQRLKSLKDMLDAGLISQAEFDTKKAEILRSL
jgi:hypothetical protein